jgi:hypothetical protein
MRGNILHDMKKHPQAVTIKPTAEDNRIISLLSKKLGLNTTSVIRQALRLLAAKEGVTA